MEGFWYHQRRLYCEGLPIRDIAREVGTPFYLYSQSLLEKHFRDFDGAFQSCPHLTCYAVKANSNLALLRLFSRMGAGFDIVSGGELLRSLRAGAVPSRIVFSGVGKTPEEIDLALSHGILQFNIESEAELRIVEARAIAANRVARISLRVNPDVDPATHPYISTGLREHKFGVRIENAPRLLRYARRSDHLQVNGIGFHIGSQITRLEPFLDALRRTVDSVLALRRAGFEIRHLDLGGGLGITYNDENPPPPSSYARAVLEILRGMDCTLLLEPGRVIVGNAGILVSRVLIVKENGGKNFIVVDAAMNDLMRPSLYGSFHAVQPEILRPVRNIKADIVGPICESGDFLARDRLIPRLREGDLLAVMSAGAYGFVLSSNYNSRPRVPEVLVRKNRFKIIRRRENFEDLIRGESSAPF